MEIFHVGAEFFHYTGGTDGHDEVYSHISVGLIDKECTDVSIR